MQLSSRDKFVLYSELAKLVGAGFGIDKAAELLEEQARNRASRRFVQGLRSGLAEGRTVSQALAGTGTGADPLEISILRATESGGVLDEGFQYLRDHFEGVSRLRRSFAGRLVYPAFLLHLAALLPVLPPLISGQPWQGGLRIALVTLGSVYLFAAVVWLGYGILDRASRTRLLVDRFLRRIPLFGGARRSVALQRFCGIFRVYLLAGSTVSVALEGAGEATQSAAVRLAANRLARLAESGQQIGEHLREQGVFPLDLVRSLGNAEKVGGLEEDLGRWAAWYGEAVESRLTRIGVWIPKAIYLLVAAYVGWQMIQTYIGIYEPILKMLDREL